MRQLGMTIGAVVPLALACGSSGAKTPAGPAPEDGRPDARQGVGGAGEQLAFWTRLLDLCGQAFEGELVEGTEPGDRDLAQKRLLMVVGSCEDEEIRIGMHAGDDRSRTWVLRQIDDGLWLQHDHREPDGTPEEVTGYGGATRDAGSPAVQSFYADDYTAELVPEAATNIWTMEIHPGDRFVYALRREVGDRRFRAVFDLTRPLDLPE